MTEEVDQLISIREAAKILGVHPSTLRNWERAGKLKAVRVGSRRDRRFRRGNVVAMAEAREPREAVSAANLKELASLVAQSRMREAFGAELAKGLGTTPAGLTNILAQYEAAMEPLSPIRDVERAFAKALPRWHEELDAAVLHVLPTLRQSLERFDWSVVDALPTFRSALQPLLWEQKLLAERMHEYIGSLFDAETFSRGVYARLAATQAELFSTQAIATLVGSFDASSVLGASSPVWDQISANIGAYQDLTRAALWDVEAVTAAVDKRLPFAELKLAGGLLASATSLTADFRTKATQAATTGVKKPNLFHYFHDEARHVAGPNLLSDAELELQLKAVKSFRAGNAGLGVVEACGRINRMAQLRRQDPVFPPSVDTLTTGSRLPLSFAGNEAEFSEVVDGLYKFIFEAADDGRRLRALAEPHEYAVVEDIVVLRQYYRHDLAQGASTRDSTRRFGRVGDVFERLVGRRLPLSAGDWHRACLALIQRVEALVTAVADRLEGRK